MQTVELKTAPEVKALIQRAFPGYKKHSAFLSVFGEHGKSINSYWDGGSRDTYTLVEIGTGRIKPLPTSSHPYFDIARQGMLNADSPDVSVDHVGNVTLKHLPEGLALIQSGTFCGKPATAHVYLPAANMAKLLPAVRS
jgi:hypothetical protein